MRTRWIGALTGYRAFGVAAATASIVLLAMGAGMTFFSDEWAFIEGRSLANVSDWFRPHNEHWSTLPVIVYRAMVETIGIGSYMPYLAVVVALHVGVAFLVYRLVRRRSGQELAFVMGLLVLLFGAGFENLFWGFQTGFVASMLFGLLALEVTDGEPTRRRALAVAILLLLSLMASGTGIVMCVAVGVEWLVEDRWRRQIAWLAIPAGAYLAWYLAYGRTGVATIRNPFSLEAAADVPPFIIGGFANAGGAIAGIGASGGVVVAGLIVAWAVVLAVRSSLPARAIALLVAVAVQYGLIGLVRGDLFAGQVAYTRYAYVSGILLLLVVSAMAGRPHMTTKPRLRAFAVAGAISVVGLAFTYNVALLIGGRELFLERAEMTRALVTAGLERPLPPTTDPDRSLVLVPSPRSLEQLTAAYGDVRTDALVPMAVRPIPPATQAEANRRVREGAPIPQPEGNWLPPATANAVKAARAYEAQPRAGPASAFACAWRGGSPTYSCSPSHGFPIPMQVMGEPLT